MSFATLLVCLWNARGCTRVFYFHRLALLKGVAWKRYHAEREQIAEMCRISLAWQFLKCVKQNELGHRPFLFACEVTTSALDGYNNAFSYVGEGITFSFDVTNSGSKTLDEFCFTDSKLGDGCLPCTSPIMSPGHGFTCVINYQVQKSTRVCGLARSGCCSVVHCTCHSDAGSDVLPRTEES